MDTNANLILGVLGLVSIPLLLAAWLVWVSAAHAVSIGSEPDVCEGAYNELAYGGDDEDDLPTTDGEPRRVDDAPMVWYWPTHSGSGSPAELLMAIHESREADGDE